MNTAIETKRVRGALIKPKQVDFSAILAVYKSNEGYWKGFAFPYNVTSQAKTKNLASKRLNDLVELYVSDLKKFGFPSHLVHQSLTDLEDREMFSRIVDSKVYERSPADSTDYHVETYKVRS